MKQRITLDQLNELSPNGQKKLLEWEIEHGYAPEDTARSEHLEKNYLLREPNIGQMIEFLDEHGDFIYSKQGSGNEYLYWTTRERGKKQNKHMRKELCDTLWKAVKEVLEK